VPGKRDKQRFVAEKEIENAGEEGGIGGGTAQGRWAEARRNKKSRQRIGLARDELKCLNRERFRHFPLHFHSLCLHCICLSERNAAYHSFPTGNRREQWRPTGPRSATGI